MVINAEQKADDPKTHVLTVQVPDQYKGRVKSIHWQINGELLSASGERVEHRFGDNDTYRIYAKAIVYCENCTKAIAICNEKDVVVGQIESPLVSNGPAPEPNTTMDFSKQKKAGTTILMGKLSNDQLTDMGWDITPAYFDYNGTTLRGETKALLDKNFKVLKENRELTVIINGYTDSRGTNDYNLHLSKQRANAVRQYLIQKGISRNRISIVGYGEEKVDNGCTDNVACEESQHQQNRKVEFNVSNNQKSITALFR
jgi:outer membrane protein OmpA-like peptidoglycan-associated protein